MFLIISIVFLNFSYLLSICISFFENCLSVFFVHLILQMFFYLWIYMKHLFFLSTYKLAINRFPPQTKISTAKLIVSSIKTSQPCFPSLSIKSITISQVSQIERSISPPQPLLIQLQSLVHLLSKSPQVSPISPILPATSLAWQSSHVNLLSCSNPCRSLLMVASCSLLCFTLHSDLRIFFYPDIEQEKQIQWCRPPQSPAMSLHHLPCNMTILSIAHGRRQWHPTPVLLPGKSHGWRSLLGCSPQGR